MLATLRRGILLAALFPALPLPQAHADARNAARMLEINDLPERRAPRHVVVVAVGDTGFSSSHSAPLPEGGYKHGRFVRVEDSLAHVRDETAGDFVFANLETVVTSRGDLPPDPRRQFVFATHPDAIGRLVAGGFNLFALANNHSADFGEAGVRETLSFAEGLGENAAAAGLGPDIEAALAPSVLIREGRRVALSAMGFGGIRAGQATAGQGSIRHPRDVAGLLSALEAEPADLRLVSVHSGTERSPFVSADELALWRDAALEKDVDLVLVHHAHVTRGIVRRGEKLAFFGLGNFAHFGTANMNGAGRCRDFSIIARIHYIEGAGGDLQLAAVEVVPIRDTHVAPRPLEAEAARERIGVLNLLSRQIAAPDRGNGALLLSTTPAGSGIFCTQAGSLPASPVREMCASAVFQEPATAAACSAPPSALPAATASHGKAKQKKPRRDVAAPRLPWPFGMRRERPASFMEEGR